jgi:DnaJ-class molecular chaperone
MLDIFDPPPDTVQCEWCHGYGSSMRDPEYVDRCTHCGGSGLVRDEDRCSTCGSTAMTELSDERQTITVCAECGSDQ